MEALAFINVTQHLKLVRELIWNKPKQNLEYTWEREPQDVAHVSQVSR